MLSIKSFVTRVMSTLRREEGQAMAEYGIILAGIAVIVMAAVFLLGADISAAFQNIVNQI